jgi:uncharacterized protein (TIGR03083 family)
LSPTRTQVIEGTFAEYEQFAELIAGLSPAEWTTPTRCANWQIRDVAGHVVGTVLDIVAGTVGQRSPDDQARELRTATAADLAGQLRTGAGRLRPGFDAFDDKAWSGPSPVPDLTLGEAVLTVWYDTYVHAEDIRAALGKSPERGPGLVASISMLENRLRRSGWGPARVELTGVPAFELGTGGPRISGDPLRFLLVGTGRADPEEFGLDDSVNIYR